MSVQTVQIEGQKEINDKLTELSKISSDMRPVFETIISDFYKSEKALVFSARPGKYADLSSSTKKSKARKVGFVYPILRVSGRLEESLTIRRSRENITENKPTELIIGTKTPYGPYLQSGTRKMPARPFHLIDVGGRRERWMRMIQVAIEKILGAK